MPVDFAIVGQLAQTLSPGSAITVPLKTQAFQCPDTGKSHLRFLAFYVQPVIGPLVCDPHTQLGVFAVVSRNIAVPVDFAILGKLAPPFET
jgi:hypothetical protein